MSIGAEAVVDLANGIDIAWLGAGRVGAWALRDVDTWGISRCSGEAQVRGVVAGVETIPSFLIFVGVDLILGPVQYSTVRSSDDYSSDQWEDAHYSTVPAKLPELLRGRSIRTPRYMPPKPTPFSHSLHNNAKVLYIKIKTYYNSYIKLATYRFLKDSNEVG